MLKTIKFKGRYFADEANLEVFPENDRLSIIYGKNNAGKERYSFEHLDDKKAIMVYRDEKQLMCFGPHKKEPYHFRLVSKKFFDAELGNDVEYSYHDSWFFKHCYESNDFGRLMELAAKEVNV